MDATSSTRVQVQSIKNEVLEIKLTVNCGGANWGMVEGPLRFHLHATSPFMVGLHFDLPNKRCELNMKVLTLISDKFVRNPQSVVVIYQARGVP